MFWWFNFAGEVGSSGIATRMGVHAERAYNKFSHPVSRWPMAAHPVQLRRLPVSKNRDARIILRTGRLQSRPTTSLAFVLP